MRLTRTRMKTTRLFAIIAAFAIVVVVASAGQSRRQAAQKLSPDHIDSDAGTVGPEDAKVTIVEFSDYQCPYCSRAAKAVGNLQEEHPDQVRIIFMDRPLIAKMKDGFSFHPWALPAHEASAEAAAQGEFKKMNVWIFSNQRKIFSLPRPKSQEDLKAGIKKIKEKLVKGAKELGLDHEEMRAALDDNRHQSVIMKRVMTARSLSINGTPAMYVNNQFVGSNVNKIKQMVEDALDQDKSSEEKPGKDNSGEAEKE